MTKLRPEKYFQATLCLLALSGITYFTSSYALTHPHATDAMLEPAYALSGSVLVFNLPYYAATASKTAGILAAALTIPLFILHTAASKKAGLREFAAFALSLTILGGGLQNTYAALAIALAAAYRHLETGGNALPEKALQKASQAAQITILATAAAALLWYTSFADMHLTSSTWMIYKKTSEIYNYGAMQKDTFFDNRFSEYPPLAYYLLAAGKQLGGQTIADTLKIFFAAGNLLLLAATYLLASKIEKGWFATITVALVALMPKLVTAPQYGNYAQLASNTFAILSLLYFASYRESKERAKIALAAAFFALTTLTHWLLAILLSGFYAIYLAGMLKKDRKDAAIFLALAITITAPYALPLAKSLLQPENSAWFATKMAQQDTETGLLNLILPVGATGDWIYLLFAFGIAGLLAGIYEKKLHFLYLLLLLPSAGYLAFRDYVTFFYPTRYLFYVQLFFSFFISYGICKTIRKPGLPLSILLAALLLSGFHQNITFATGIAKGEQPLGQEDFAAVMWLKENAHKNQTIAADAMRSELAHGFTSLNIATPSESAEAFKDPASGRHILFLSEAGACKFPCSREIQLRKDAALTGAWMRLSYDETIKRIEENGFVPAFSEGRARIYLPKGQ